MSHPVLSRMTIGQEVRGLTGGFVGHVADIGRGRISIAEPGGASFWLPTDVVFDVSYSSVHLICDAPAVGRYAFTD